MNPILHPLSWLLFFSLVCGGGLMAATVWFWQRKTRQAGRRSPLTRDLLRSPGESLRGVLEDRMWDLSAYFTGVALAPAGLLAAYMTSWAMSGRAPHPVAAVFSLITLIAIEAWLLRKLWTLLKDIRGLRLGYEAEVAVGQELHELARLGYHIFHDIPAKERVGNVDHAVVGPAGVFAIETKGRSKPDATKNGNAGWEVAYDGESLQFPGWPETKPLEQAQSTAKWLGEWLSSATGEPVRAQPLLLLPGWFVRRTSGHGIPVLTTRQIQGFFRGLRVEERLSVQSIQRIVHQLDQRCRDVAPKAYRK